MKRTRFHRFLPSGLAGMLAAAGVLFAVPPSAPEAPLNVARHTQGADLLFFDPTAQTYRPTEAAADWLDDCVGTGRVPEKGRSHYLLKLPSAQLFSRFDIDTKGCAGTVTLFGGDEPLPPGASWRLLARDLDIATLATDDKARSLNCFAKYLLIETRLSAIAPWFDIHLYGENPAAGLVLRKRDKPLNVRSVGVYVNVETSISLSRVAASATVTSEDPGKQPADLQKIIDNNIATGTYISSLANHSINYPEQKSVRRVAVLVGLGVKGTLKISAEKDSGVKTGRATPVPAWRESLGQTQFILAAWDPSKDSGREPNSRSSRLGNSGRSTSGPATPGLSTERKEVASFDFDGKTPRLAADFDPTDAKALVLHWQPATPGEKLFIIEVDSFGRETLRHYEYMLPEVAEGPNDVGTPYPMLPVPGPFPIPRPVSP